MKKKYMTQLEVIGKCKVKMEDGSKPTYSDLVKAADSDIDAEFHSYMRGYGNEPRAEDSQAFFVMGKKDKQLYVLVRYFYDKKLSSEEIKAIGEYTQGQWSDGIGESYEQEVQNDAYISMWYRGQQPQYKVTNHE